MNNFKSLPTTLPTPLGHFSLRRLTGEDLAEILAVEQRSHPTPWKAADFISSLTRHTCVGLFNHQHQLCAYAVISVVIDEAELLLFVVDQSYSGKGLGKAFLACLLSWLQGSAARMFLEVRASNAPAIGLYETSEFNQIGVRNGYYPGPKGGREDALIYAREFLP